MRNLSRPRRMAPLSAAVGCLLLLGFAANALAVHPRPGSATPMRIPLVQAFTQCSPSGFYYNHQGAPSCPGPGLESGILTSGSNGVGGGTVVLRTFCAAPSTGNPPCNDVGGDQQDISVTGNVTDVQCAGSISPCAGAGTDYTGSVIYNLPTRLTDHTTNGPFIGSPCPNGAGTSPCITGTVIDAYIGQVVSCVGVGAVNTAPGSNCNFTSTVDTVFPGTVLEVQRQSFRFWDEFLVLDLGPDQATSPSCPVNCGTGDEGITRAQGVFAP